MTVWSKPTYGCDEQMQTLKTGNTQADTGCDDKAVRRAIGYAK